jgi:hypothetical protein
MFIDAKRFFINTDQITHIDKSERTWTVYLSDGKSVPLELEWAAELQKFLAGESSSH